MWDLCTIDWPKEDAANFESQNFFLVLILPKYLESAQKCCNFWDVAIVFLQIYHEVEKI